VIGDKAEQAYRRSDALEKRRKLMDAWARYCTTAKTGKVVAVSARGAIARIRPQARRWLSDGARMAKPPIDPPKLSREVALQIAAVACVPSEQREQFCDLVQVTVQTVWELDRRATSSTPGQALIDAAQAARTLHNSAGHPEQAGPRMATTIFGFPTSGTQGSYASCPLTVWRLAHLFSTVIGSL